MCSLLKIAELIGEQHIWYAIIPTLFPYFFPILLSLNLFCVS